MTSIKRDDHKQQWESGSDTEFPLVCETCLGDNPFLRMTKEAHGKKCRVCEVPFTVFAWQAGTKGRLKKVEICQSCARTKNVCQVCIYDLQYGLPVQVRDRVLAEHGGLTNNTVVAPPESDANLSWFTQSQKRALENGSLQNNACVPVEAAAKLRRLARMDPRYERNLPKLCSFFARGECDRGAACPFRHEAPRDRNDPLSKQNTRDRFYGTNDPVASKMLKADEERAEARRAELAGEDGSGTGTTVLPTTVYCRLPDGSDATEADVRDKFYAHGEIVSVRFGRDRSCAFVEYASPASARVAVAAVDRTRLRAGDATTTRCRLARADRRGDAVARTAPGSGTTARPLRPPGASTTSTTTTRQRSFAPVVPSAEVLAAGRAARRAAVPAGGTVVADAPRPRSNLGSAPRPSGAVGVPRPYYPSADPGRLGSRATTRSDARP